MCWGFIYIHFQKVKGVYSNSYKLALEASNKFNWANLTSTYLNPYTLEGDKTVAFELFSQMAGEVPDYIFVPIGAGPLLYGIFKGFEELNILGLCSKIPAMVGVQAENCSPIVSAYQQNKKRVVSWDKANYTVSITDKSNEQVTNNYSETDLYWLSRIIEAEASGESYEGKVATANVIINRKKSSQFPNTIKGVVFDNNYGIQFTPVKNGTMPNWPAP